MPSPSSRARRTKQRPRCPARILQKRGQTRHSIRPSSSLVQCSTSTQYSESASIARRPLSRGRSSACSSNVVRSREQLQCGALARRAANAYTSATKRSGVAMLRSEVHPAQVAGMFYPAEPETLRALIAGVRKRARLDGNVGAEGRRRAARRHRLFRVGRGDRVRPWARRPEPPRRVVIVGPAHRVAFRGLAIHPAADLADAARRGRDRARSPCAPRGSQGRCGRCAAVRGRAFARNASPDAPGDAAQAVRNSPDPGRRRRPARNCGSVAPCLGRAGDCYRRLLGPHAFSRFGERTVDRRRHRPADRDP